MNNLSCFDGMSCLQIALHRAGIDFNNYYASEIDKHAIKVTQNNYPVTVQLGDVRNWKSWNIKNIDLITGGFPCQSFSIAGKQLGLEDIRGQLLFHLLKIIKHLLQEMLKNKAINTQLSFF